jgi:hypothetical protein
MDVQVDAAAGRRAHDEHGDVDAGPRPALEQGGRRAENELGEVVPDDRDVGVPRIAHRAP